MKKIDFLWMVLALCMTIGFSACSDDEGDSGDAPSLPTPVYESVSGRYDVTSAGSPYESIELGASGNYIVTLDQGGYTKSAPSAGRASFLHRRAPQTRAVQSGNIVYGTFRDLGDGRYELEDFGTVELIYGSGGQVTGIDVDSSRYGSASLAVQKAATVPASDMSNVLCRTWTVQRYREVTTNLETGERREEEFEAGQDPDVMDEFMFSKSGTFISIYGDNTVDKGSWRWKDERGGVIYYLWDAEDWEEEGELSFSVEGNTATFHEALEDEGYYYESYIIATTDTSVPDTPGVDDPDEPINPASPLDKVFTGRRLRSMSDDTFVYENGFLTQVLDEDHPDAPIATFHYNYITGEPGADVLVRDEEGNPWMEVTLGTDGFASTVRNVTYDCTNTFTYDADGHLVLMDDGRNERNYTLTWTDGNLTHVEWTSKEDGYTQSLDFTYSGQANADNLMFYYIVYDVDIDEIQYLYYAGLLGCSTTHLPEAVIDAEDGSSTAIHWTDSYMYMGDDPNPSDDYVHPFSFMD